MTSPTGDFQLPSAADMDAAARARTQALADKAHASASGTDADGTAEVPEYTVPYSPDPDELSDKQRANQSLFGAPGAEGSNPRDRVDDGDAPQRRARWSTAITAAVIVGAALFGAAATWAYGQFIGASGTVSSTTVLDTHAGRITVEPDGTVTGPRGVVIEPDGTVHRAGDDAPRGPVTRPAAPGEPGAGDPANTGRTAEETPDEESPDEESPTETTAPEDDQ